MSGVDTTAMNMLHQDAGEVETPVVMVRTVLHWKTKDGQER